MCHFDTGKGEDTILASREPPCIKGVGYNPFATETAFYGINEIFT